MLRRLVVTGSMRFVGRLALVGVAAPACLQTRSTFSGRKDSNRSNDTHFDIQDIDADRLTHRYWDDLESPYDIALEEFEEGGVDSFTHVLPDDRGLLKKEFLASTPHRAAR